MPIRYPANDSRNPRTLAAKRATSGPLARCAVVSIDRYSAAAPPASTPAPAPNRAAGLPRQPTSEWRRCEHWAIDAVIEQRRARALSGAIRAGLINPELGTTIGQFFVPRAGGFVYAHIRLDPRRRRCGCVELWGQRVDEHGHGHKPTVIEQFLDGRHGADTQAEVRRVLGRGAAPAQADNDQLDKCYKLEQSVDSYDSTYSGWAAAAQCSHNEAKLDKRVADKLAAIVPPKSLRRSYLAYVRSYRTDGQSAAGLSSTLTKRQFFNWNTYYGSAFHARNQVVANFRVAVIAYAAQHGFGVPGWVHHIGGK